MSSGNISSNSTQNYVDLELYSVVLSVSALCLAILFGSGGNLIIITSICRFKLFCKVRYVLILLLVTICLLFDVMYCPLEIYHLMLESKDSNTQSVLEDSVTRLKFAGSSIYIFFITAITCILTFVSIHNLCVLTEKFTSFYRYILCSFCVIISLSVTIAPAIGYGIMSKTEENQTDSTAFHILNQKSYIFRVILFSLWIILMLLVLAGMISFIVVAYRAKTSDIDESSLYSQQQTSDHLNVPTLLIKGSDSSINNSENEEPEDNEAEVSNNLLDSYSAKEDNASTIGDLPSPSRTAKSHHLGINMAAYLGRRRHTIGQIGTTGADQVLDKAKQYNYIRKFSVDIQALQAQLENPKIHASDFPFRSDTELQKSLQNSTKASDLLKRPLVSAMETRSGDITKLDEKISERVTLMEKVSRDENKQDNPGMPAANLHDNNDLQDESLQEIPPVITLSETTADEFLEGVHKKKEKNSSCFIKLSCLLVIAFICCILPMFITEGIQNHISTAAYVNIVTCFISLSTIQTIIFPHIIFCMDSRIHKYAHKLISGLHQYLLSKCYKRESVPTTNNVEISTSQV